MKTPKACGHKRTGSKRDSDSRAPGGRTDDTPVVAENTPIASREVGSRVGRRAAGGASRPIDAISQPFRDAAKSNAAGRYRMACGSEADRRKARGRHWARTSKCGSLPQRLALIVRRPSRRNSTVTPSTSDCTLFPLFLQGVTRRVRLPAKVSDRACPGHRTAGEATPQEKIATLKHHRRPERKAKAGTPRRTRRGRGLRHRLRADGAPGGGSVADAVAVTPLGELASM